MNRRVFVTGASGFVGSAVVEALVGCGIGVNTLVNRRPIRSSGDVRSISGSVFDANALDQGMHDCDAVIHLVGIIFEKPSKGVTFQRLHVDGTRAVVEAAQRNGIKRYVHMSALGTRADAVSNYHRTKYAAEQLVRNSSLDWTLIRPSMIHGPGGEFMQMEAMWARGKAPSPLFVQPFMPYFGGSSAGILQPVYVSDVARAFVDCLDRPQTIHQTYELGGSQRLTWPQMHEIVAQAVVGHRRWTAGVPVFVAKTLVALGLGPVLGFNWDQIIMSQEDNTCDLSKFIADFGWTPAEFESTVKQYAALL